MPTDCVQMRCGADIFYLPLKVRDLTVFDNHFHMPNGWVYRGLVGLDFVRGLGAPPEEVVLRTWDRVAFREHIRCMKRDLEKQGDLLQWHYSYVFSSQPGQTHGGGMSGFRVRGMHASISVRPSGYCDLELSVIRNGRLIFEEMIDMRVVLSVETDDLGVLKCRRRRAHLIWFEELPKILAFLDQCSADKVEILHTHLPENSSGQLTG